MKSCNAQTNTMLIKVNGFLCTRKSHMLHTILCMKLRKKMSSLYVRKK